MMPIWLPVWQLVGASSSLAILFIVVLLVTMVAYINRCRPDIMSSSCVVIGPSPSEIELTYQTSPFQVTLCDATVDRKQTLDSGVQVELQSQRAYWFLQLWGVEVTAFHEEMKRDWKTLRTAVKDGSFLSGKSVDRSCPELCYENESEKLLRPSRSIQAADLGRSPRSRFPLVLVMILADEEEGEDTPDPQPTDTVALICAIHVQDVLCTSDTAFVFKVGFPFLLPVSVADSSVREQLSKLASGQVLNVSHLYTRESGEEAAICLICETRRVTIGLLPCRHFSLCDVCYSLLEPPKRCPVCRSYITRFFRHKTAESQDSSLDEPRRQEMREPTWMSRAFARLFSH